jgi:hypothetical protein
MSRFVVTQHAIERYIERVAAVTQDEARRRLAASEKAVMMAEAIGCRSVKLGCGARLALVGAKIVTVYPPPTCGNSFRPRAIRRDWTGE